ncbi:IS5 family transposase [Caballeronia sp. GAFFF1]|uniref:IS5 family transposase n=1 Tax=Caballeronia sp. GAFFF1 TaxID=2921779 RepID=UPI0032EEFD99
MATSWRIGSLARNTFGEAASSGQNRLVARDRGLVLDSRGRGGRKTGPNPTDRARPGSKHHLATDANGTPIAAVLTGANRNDVTQLVPLIEAIVPIVGRRGRPLSRPGRVYADHGSDHDKYRRVLHARSVPTSIARRGHPHDSGLGKVRWVVERTHAWLHHFRRLRIRFERRADIHEAFLKLACCLICWNTLQRGLQSL